MRTLVGRALLCPFAFFGLLTLGALATLGACSTTDPGRAALQTGVEGVIRELGPDVLASVWLSEPLGEPLLAIRPGEPMPVASAIKAGYLVELFAAFPGGLDLPLPGCEAVLGDDEHPAVAHLGPARRATAQRALQTASVRRVGEAMITGRGVDNATYNIAANLVTAHFGGPAGLCAALHRRAPGWRGLMVRRYMLADRNENGDNEATAAALASVHGMLAKREVPGVDARAIEAARAILALPEDDAGRSAFFKGGSLNTEPMARIRAGWREGTDRTLVYVVMLSRSNVAENDREAAGEQLADATRRIEQLLLR